MSGNSFKSIRYISEDESFIKTLKKRVDEYFSSTNKPRTGDYRIWLKVLILPLIYIAPLILLLLNLFGDNMILFYGLWLIMGIGLAGCGFGIMHDACHGAISKNKNVNDFLGFLVLTLAGGSTVTWKIQHNVLHHSYTNVDGYDEDIDPSGLMRFSPHQPIKSFFKYQVLYAWFLYGLMTFEWATYKDFLQLSRYNKRGLLQTQGATLKSEIFKLILQKIFYYCLFIVLPILLIDLPWWHIVLGWLTMHFVAGLTLGLVFQPAHVVPTSEFPKPNDENQVKGDWATYQMLTTANFAPKNWLLSWYVGGLNYQIEHHLFPNMCHIHHKKVSIITRETAKEFGIPYHSQKTFIGAIVNHGKMLYKLRK